MKLSIVVVAALAVGCGSSDESPFGKGPQATSDGGGGGTTNPPGSGNPGPTTPAGDSGTPDNTGIACNKTPERYVVLGHSVAHCFAVGGVDSLSCASKKVQDDLAKKHAGLTYENYAVDGALIADVVRNQLSRVQGGQGHVLLNLFIGGNDLAAHIYENDAQARKSWDTLRPKAVADFETILGYVEDTAKFPKGATVLLNGQYNPFDECTAGTYSFVTPAKQAIIGEFNAELIALTKRKKNVVFVDHYPSFLGHGHHYNRQTCPKYKPNMEGWMADMVHPNDKGHVSLAREMNGALDLAFKCN
jgi:lysophospholipase L1-like esterase